MGEEPERLRARKLARQVIEHNGPADRSDEGLLARELLALLAEVERLAGERDEAHDKGWDEGREALLSEPVCSKCGQNHDRDESAMCEGGEVILFRELPAECERLAGRVAALEEALTEARPYVAWATFKVKGQDARLALDVLAKVDFALADVGGPE